MQTPFPLQRSRSRSRSESANQLTAQSQPSSWSDAPSDRAGQDASIQPSFDFSRVDLFSHAPPPRPPIQMKLTVDAPDDPYEQEADEVAQQVMNAPDPAVQPAIQRQEGEEELQAKPLAATITPLVQRQEIPEARTIAIQPSLQRASTQEDSESSDTLENRLSRSTGSGSPLPAEVRDFMEPRFGTDFSQVRVHTGSEAVQMNRDLNAQAFTHGSHVYFGAGKSPAKDGLTAHELTHVVQQTGSAHRKLIQRAIAPTYDVTQGQFQVNATAGGSNLPINITFQPNATADYSNQISLIQIVRLTNTTGANVPPATLPAGRAASLRTAADAGTGAEAGYFTDVYHNDPNAQPNTALPPQYGYGPAGNPTGSGTLPTPGLSRPLSPTFAPVPEVGFKRSADPADIKAAKISDAPGYASATPVPPDLDFSFETVAKGEDVNKVYGGLKWSFQIRAGVAQNETATAQDGQSATFDAALERHRDFYLHEPVIFYFEFNKDTLSTTEIAKIASFKAYLTRFSGAPKLVRVSPEGFADQRGKAAHNLDLSLRRATAVKNALLAEGIPAAQINPVTVGSGATTGFTPDATTDQDRDANRRGNRRVVLTFQEVASPPAGGTP